MCNREVISIEDNSSTSGNKSPTVPHSPNRNVISCIPAECCLLLQALISACARRQNKSLLKIFFRDRNKHSSPNSGQSESAYAGALGIQFGGKISYFGKDYEKQKIGDKLKEFDYEDIKKAVNILYVVSFIVAITFILTSIIVVLLE